MITMNWALPLDQHEIEELGEYNIVLSDVGMINKMLLIPTHFLLGKYNVNKYNFDSVGYETLLRSIKNSGYEFISFGVKNGTNS